MNRNLNVTTTPTRKKAVDAWVYSFIELNGNPICCRTKTPRYNDFYFMGNAIGISVYEIKGSLKRLGLNKDDISKKHLLSGRPLVFPCTIGGEKGLEKIIWFKSIFEKKNIVSKEQILRKALKAGIGPSSLIHLKTSLKVRSAIQDDVRYWVRDEESFKDFIEQAKDEILKIVVNDKGHINGYTRDLVSDAVAKKLSNPKDEESFPIFKILANAALNFLICDRLIKEVSAVAKNKTIGYVLQRL